MPTATCRISRDTLIESRSLAENSEGKRSAAESENRMRFTTAAGTCVMLFATLVLFAGASPAQKSRQQTASPPRSSTATSPKPKPDQKPSTDSDVGTNDETVRLNTDLVNLLFTAVDRNNRVISDVRQEDVSILEDGKPQPIFTFKRETTLPINIAILMDLSGSQEYTFPQEKLAAGEFLRSVIRQGRDRAAVLTFQDDVELVQGLTSKLDTLNRSFDEIQFARRFGSSTIRRQATALYDAVYITADEILTPS